MYLKVADSCIIQLANNFALYVCLFSHNLRTFKGQTSSGESIFKTLTAFSYQIMNILKDNCLHIISVTSTYETI